MSKIKPIILLGIQGSGKGTQAKVICDVYDIPYIETGGLLRRHLEEGTKYAPDIEPILRGEYVKDDVVNKVIGEEILKLTNSGKSFVLDGFPRSPQQAEFLGNLLKDAQVFNIDIPRDVAVKRLLSRKYCSSCKAILTSADLECGTCGSTDFNTRQDDTPEGIKRRLELNEQKSLPTIEVLKSMGYDYASINGDRVPDEVAYSITRCIDYEESKGRSIQLYHKSKVHNAPYLYPESHWHISEDSRFFEITTVGGYKVKHPIESFHCLVELWNDADDNVDGHDQVYVEFVNSSYQSVLKDGPMYLSPLQATDRALFLIPMYGKADKCFVVPLSNILSIRSHPFPN